MQAQVWETSHCLGCFWSRENQDQTRTSYRTGGVRPQQEDPSQLIFLITKPATHKPSANSLILADPWP